jgi:aspartate/methionine/tyrosine aminotransferase
MGYSTKYSNIHTVRGFAKDSGICGFKFGFLISCNENVKKSMNEWKSIISHH